MKPSAILGVQHSPPPQLPPGSCDCHTHVFGPAARYGFDAARSYTPPDATTADLLAHQRALGLARVVIVQPSPYGFDNRCTLDAAAELGDQARVVAVVPSDLAPAALQDLDRRGVRGLRINLHTAGQSDPAGAAALLAAAAEQAAPLGWHVQVYTSLDVIQSLHTVLRQLPVPLVVDHFGRAMAVDGTGQAGFDALLDLVQCGRAYVKLSAAHRIADDPEAAGPIAAALIAANPARMLWGSDWPHPGAHPESRQDPTALEPFNPVDDGAALHRLRTWAGTEANWRAILVDNPARLYRFNQE